MFLNFCSARRLPFWSMAIDVLRLVPAENGSFFAVAPHAQRLRRGTMRTFFHESNEVYGIDLLRITWFYVNKSEGLSSAPWFVTEGRLICLSLPIMCLLTSQSNLLSLFEIYTNRD